METSHGCFFVLITLAIIHIVQAHDQQGFISLDCGLSTSQLSPYIQQGFISLDCGLPTTELSPYTDTSTGLQFSSDKNFIQGGRFGRVQTDSTLRRQYKTLRYFPDGIRNCYNLNVEKGRKYMIRASFMYGNYDGRNMKPVFDLYLGPNLWETIDLVTHSNGIAVNIVHITPSNSLQICLVKTGETIPLISALELRPVENDSYITKSGSLAQYYLNYLCESKPISRRFGDDVYDRIWSPFFKKEWTHICTTLNVSNSDKYGLPKDVLRTAAKPCNASSPLTFEWLSSNPDDQYYLYAHFAEIQDLQANETREFNLAWNGEVISDHIVPQKLKITTIESLSPQTCYRGRCSVQLTRTNRSTLPPLLNAFEVYRVIQFPQSDTDETDVDAIKNIAAAYGLSRNNWQGDPCVPKDLRWDGLNCSDTDMSTPPSITTLNLSSSGLTGTVAAAIQDLKQLKKLDLSNNNLTGEVPEFLGNMKSLSVINLSGNNLNGSIPRAMQREGLELLVEGNPRLCLSDSCRIRHTKKSLLPVIASVASVAIVIAALVLFLILKNKNSTTVEGLHLPPTTVDVTFADKKSKRFTYLEVIKMTKNFERVLGKGGFGMVYHGTLNGSEQVAVKLLSQSSTQGYKEFKAEVDLLMRVHHTNLVRLVGYCYEGDHLALIYEFLSNGDLKQHLSGKGGKSIINWSIRLRIALEAAQGLEYLHIGCTLPMVHRDVKTANILLDENFKAKLADFGLSRSFRGESQVMTDVAGTPGYLDPEYFLTHWLAEKSDVYSFGIVLLEMITNQPVIDQTSKNPYITQWVGLKLNGGDINEIMDPNLRMDYDSNSAWRALELAMSCTDPSSSKRPSMSQVINELKECIVCQNSGKSKNPGLEYQEMNISLDSSLTPTAR